MVCGCKTAFKFVSMPALLHVTSINFIIDLDLILTQMPPTAPAEQQTESTRTSWKAYDRIICTIVKLERTTCTFLTSFTNEVHILLLSTDGGVDADCVRPVCRQLPKLDRVWLDKNSSPTFDIFKVLCVTELDAVQSPQFNKNTIVQIMKVFQFSTSVFCILAVIMSLPPGTKGAVLLVSKILMVQVGVSHPLW